MRRTPATARTAIVLTSSFRTRAITTAGLVILFGIAATLASVLKWKALAFLAIIFMIPAGIAVLAFLNQRYLAYRFRRKHPGCDLLIVYTDGDAWKSRIEQVWLPWAGERALAFNRSQPWNRRQLEARLWQAFAEEEEHTPLAIYLPRAGAPAAIAYYDAFRDWQHGRRETLDAAEDELAALLTADPLPRAT